MDACALERIRDALIQEDSLDVEYNIGVELTPVDPCFIDDALSTTAHKHSHVYFISIKYPRDWETTILWSIKLSEDNKIVFIEESKKGYLSLGGPRLDQKIHRIYFKDVTDIKALANTIINKIRKIEKIEVF